MSKNHLFNIAANFLGIVFLISLISLPFLFAADFAKVAGVKTQAKYLIVSQIDKFPNLSLSQLGDQYTITVTKLGPSQAFLDLAFVNNPTDQNQTYTIKTESAGAEVFFGDNLDNQQTKISVPGQTSIPISLLSDPADKSQSVEFQIEAN